MQLANWHKGFASVHGVLGSSRDLCESLRSSSKSRKSWDLKPRGSLNRAKCGLTRRVSETPWMFFSWLKGLRPSPSRSRSLYWFCISCELTKRMLSVVWLSIGITHAIRELLPGAPDGESTCSLSTCSHDAISSTEPSLLDTTITAQVTLGGNDMVF